MTTEDNKNYLKALNQIKKNQIDKAIQSLSTCITKSPDYTNCYWQRARLYLEKVGDTTAAIQDLQECLQPEFESQTLVWMALIRLYWDQGSYNEVLKLTNQRWPNDLSSHQKKLAIKIVRDSRYIQSVTALPGKPPIPLPELINSELDEYWPSFTADQKNIVFTRRILNQEDIYYSVADSSGWTDPLPIREINTYENEGAHTISADGKLIFFTACNRREAMGSCDLYYSSKSGHGWTRPINLGAPVNSSAWEAQPSLAPDNRLLVFSSDRDGGFGGKDLWMSIYSSKGKWSEPVNLGPTINTEYDEQSPFIAFDNQTLYFVSDGHPGFGEDDIFMSHFENKIWSNPLNLGRDINSKGDETALRVTITGDQGIIARRTAEKRDFDLFEVKLPIRTKAIPATYVRFICKDIRDSSLIEKVNIEIKNTRAQVILRGQSNQEGEKLVCLPRIQNYIVHLFKDGYALYSERFALQENMTPIDAEEFEVYLIRDDIADLDTSRPIVLKNVLFQFGSDEFLNESYVELDRLSTYLEQNPDLQIEIHGHTDDIGDEEDNLLLSEKRAQAVVDYLVSKGIDTNRLAAKGFGESRPILPNTSEENQSQNRRTEFILKHP